MLKHPTKTPRIRDAIGISERDISVLIVALRGAAMRYKDAPAETLLAFDWRARGINERAIASFAHDCEQLAARVEKTRATVFNVLEHNVVLAALRICALEWPKMAAHSSASKRAMMIQFSRECATLSDRLDVNAAGLPPQKVN